MYISPLYELLFVLSLANIQLYADNVFVGEFPSQRSTNASEAGCTREYAEGPAIKVCDTRHNVEIHSINAECALYDAEKH